MNYFLTAKGTKHTKKTESQFFVSFVNFVVSFGLYLLTVLCVSTFCG
jgi:hypothetical protein